MTELLALQLGGLRRGQGRDALLGQPVVLDQLGLAGLVDPPVGVHAEALHGAVRRRQAARAEHHRHHVHGLGRLADEVENPVRVLPVEVHRVGLLGVDEVRELDRVADEEDGQVVADEVPVAVLGVELEREASGVAHQLGGVPAAGDGREAQGCLGALALGLEQLCAGEVGDRQVAAPAVGLEVAERGGATGVNDPLRDALAIEVADLLEELIVLERRRPARADAALVLVVVDGVALAVRQDVPLVVALR